MIITQLIFLLFIIFFIRYKKKAVLYIIPLSLFFTMLPVVRIGGTYIGLCDAINFVIYGYILGRKDARKAIFCNPLFLPLFGNFILLLLIALYGTERTSLYVLWKTISNEILLPLAFIYFLRTKNDIKLIVNLYLKVFWVLCIYGIIEFLVCFYYFGCFDGVEVSQFRVAREILAVFVLQHLIPVDGIIHDVSQVVINLGNFLFHLGDQFIRLV